MRFLKRLINNLRYAFWRHIRDFGFNQMDKSIQNNPKAFKTWGKITLYALKRNFEIDIS